MLRGFHALQLLVNIKAKLSQESLSGFCKLQRQIASHYTESKQNHWSGEGKKIGRKQQTNPKGTRKPSRFQEALCRAHIIWPEHSWENWCSLSCPCCLQVVFWSPSRWGADPVKARVPSSILLPPQSSFTVIVTWFSFHQKLLRDSSHHLHLYLTFSAGLEHVYATSALGETGQCRSVRKGPLGT